MHKKYFLLIFVLILGAFFYGAAIIEFQIFPYDSIKEIKKKNLSKNTDLLIGSEIYEDDVSSLEKINDDEDIFYKQNLLIQYIWKNTELPTNSDLQLEKNIFDARYENFENLESIDKIFISMDYNVNSISYLFHSKTSNDNLVIYHQGHKGDFIHGSKTIQKLLINGYDVLAFSMPLTGMNNKPIVDLPNFGKIKLSTHNHLQLLESNNFSPIKYFLEPITITLNYLDEKYDYESISMIGISGGGWTTTLYSAIDERISNSFSIAGTYPIYLKSEPKNFGDYEQTILELYTIANYLELYVMSSFGENRSHVQFFNKNDPCCYSGTLFESYIDVISQKVITLDHGNFTIYLDDTHDEHEISEYSLNKIIEHLP